MSERTVIQRDSLGVLTEIGQGGRGVVCRAPNLKTKFAASMVYKEHRTETLAGIDLAALATMSALLEDSLSHAQAERLISIAAWPCALVEIGGAPTGFVMPTIPEKFLVSSSTAAFQHLLDRPAVLVRRGIEIDDAQRYSLLREVASALAFLHRHGACVGDISPKNLLFSLTPHAAVYFIDCDAMRINGISALPQMETPGWETAAGDELATIYSDAYKLGLLALRLLAGDRDTKSLQHIPPTTPEPLRQIITDALNIAPQQRPLPEAWTYLLGDAIEQAQHQKKTATPTPTPVSPPAPPPTPIVRSRRPVDASPPIGEPGLPVKPSISSAKMWAGVTLAAVVIAAVAVITVALINHNNPAPSSAPATSSASPSSSSSPPTTAPPPPVASASLPGLAPFAREWRGMRESVEIDLTGHGHFHYMMACATCSMAEMPYNTLDFTLTSVSNGTASGSVSASSDPHFPVGEPVAATLGPQDTIQWTVGGKNVGLFCGSNPAWCGY
jgi:serine/threonine protein kinase